MRELELDLDTFEGPFDLLLTLVLREELDLAEVDVAAVVLAFVERLAERASHPWAAAAPAGRSPAPPPPAAAGPASPSGAVPSTVPSGAADPAAAQEREVQRLDLDACGEFLVLVSALLELKARGLFPDEEAELAELEPEEAAEELARRLAEYRRTKAAAAWLAERLESEGDRFFRLGPAPLAPVPEPTLPPQEPESLAAALRALAAEPPSVSLSHMALRFPPVSQFVERFRALLRKRRRLDFDQEVAGLSRVEQAVAFLALLELRKAGEIRLEQAAPFAPVRIARPDDERSLAWNARSA
ncbi:MAG: segregation/condensation protein A [Gaiellaceae bacterium]